MFRGLRTLVFGNYDDEIQENTNKEIHSPLGETRQILPSVEEQEKQLSESQRQQQQSTIDEENLKEQHNVDGKVVSTFNNYDDESWELLDYEQLENVDNKTRVDNGHESVVPKSDTVVNDIESNIELPAQTEPEQKNVDNLNTNVEVATAAATAKRVATAKTATKKSDAKSKSTKKIDTAVATKIDRNVTGRGVVSQLVTPPPPPPPPPPPMQTAAMSSGLKRQRPESSSWSASSDSDDAESSDFSDCDYSYGGAMASLRGSSNKSAKSRVRSTLTSITKERSIIKSNQQAIKQAQQLKPPSMGIATGSTKDCQLIATVVKLASDEPTIVNNSVPTVSSCSGTKKTKKKRVAQDQNSSINNKNSCAMISVQFQSDKSNSTEEELEKCQIMSDTKLIDDETTAKAMNSSSIVSSNDSSDAAMDDSWYVTPPPCFNGPLMSSKISIVETNATNANTFEKQTLPIVEGEKLKENVDLSENTSSTTGVNPGEALSSQELANSIKASSIDDDSQAELEKLLNLENLLIEHPSMFIPKPARYGSHQRPKQRIRSQQNNSVSGNVTGKTKDKVDANVAKLTKSGSATANKNELKQQKMSPRVTVAKGPTSSTTDLMAPPPVKPMSKAKRQSESGFNKAKAQNDCIKPVVSNVIESNISGGKPVSSSSTSSSVGIASSELNTFDKSKSSTVANTRSVTKSALVISVSKVPIVKSSSMSAKSFLKTPTVKLAKNKSKTKRNGTAGSNKVKLSMKDVESSPVKLIASRSLETPVKVSNPVVDDVKLESIDAVPSTIGKLAFKAEEDFKEQQNEETGWQSEPEDDSFSSSSSVIADVHTVVASNVSCYCESSDDDEAVSGIADNNEVCLTSIMRIANDDDIVVPDHTNCSINESRLVSMESKQSNEPSVESEENLENTPPSRVLQHQRREARICHSDTHLPHWQKCKRRGRQRMGELHRNLLASAKVSDSSKWGSYSPMASMLAAERVSSMSSLSGSRDRTRSPPIANPPILYNMMKMAHTVNELEKPLLSATSNLNSKGLADNSAKAARSANQRQLAKSSTPRHNQVAVMGSNTRRADRRARMAQRPNGCSVNRKVHTNFPKN